MGCRVTHRMVQRPTPFVRTSSGGGNCIQLGATRASRGAAGAARGRKMNGMDHPRRARRIAAALLVLASCCPGVARANRGSAALRARAAVELYNLDHDRALASFRDAVAADPQDPAAHRGLAIGLWLNISFRRGNMTVDDYLGGITRQSTAGVPAPPQAAAAFRETLDRALA